MNIEHSTRHLARLEPSMAEIRINVRDIGHVRRMRGNPVDLTLDESREMIISVRMFQLDARIADRAIWIRLVRRRSFTAR